MFFYRYEILLSNIILLQKNSRIDYMKSSFKTVILFLAATAVSSVAEAQNATKMEENKMQCVADTVKNGYQKIEDGVVKGYKAIENGVVKGYTAIQDGVVEGYTRISDAFVKKFLMRDGETLEQTKARIAREEEELHRQSQERVSASRQRAEEAGHKAKERAEVNNK